MSYRIPRHKVFISFYNGDDRQYKEALVNMMEYNYAAAHYQSIFDDYSVAEGEIDDEGKSDEEVRKIIRDDFIRNAKVLILLCGKNTKRRKFIDWELHAAMYHNEDRPRLGILVINLPSIKGNQAVYKGRYDDGELIVDNAVWRTITKQEEYEASFPFMPQRIIDNYVSGLEDNSIFPISVVDWDRIANNPRILKQLIDNAFNDRNDDKLHYNFSRPLRRNNS